MAKNNSLNWTKHSFQFFFVLKEVNSFIKWKAGVNFAIVSMRQSFNFTPDTSLKLWAQERESTLIRTQSVFWVLKKLFGKQEFIPQKVEKTRKSRNIMLVVAPSSFIPIKHNDPP